MSAGDTLERAVLALRAEGDAAPGNGKALRARVLLGATTRARRKRAVAAWLLPIAATLVVSSAWAASNGRAERTMAAVREALGGPRALVVSGRGPAAQIAAYVRSARPVASGATAPSSAPVVVPPLVSIDDLPRAVSAPPSAPASTPPLHPAPPPDAVAATAEADTLYAAAHRAHFVDRDPAAAVVAWDAYLRAAPNGRLAPEARYDRALMLVRLGRLDEADAALRPFADGAYGSYRRAEATEIIAAIGRARSAPGGH